MNIRDDLEIGEVVGHDVRFPGRVAFVQDATKLRPRAGHVAVALDNLMLVWGGYNVGSPMENRDQFINACELFVYHTEIEKWFIFKISEGSVPSQCSGATAVVVGHVLYIFGGFYGYMDTFRTWRHSWTIHSLDLRTMRWSTDLHEKEKQIFREYMRRQQRVDPGMPGEFGDDGGDQQDHADGVDQEEEEEEEDLPPGGPAPTNQIGAGDGFGQLLGGVRNRRRGRRRENNNHDSSGDNNSILDDQVYDVEDDYVIDDAGPSTAGPPSFTQNGNTSSEKPERWTKLVPTPRHKFVGWEHRGKLYYFGGFGTPPEQMPREFSEQLHYRFMVENGTFVMDEHLTYDSAWNNQVVAFDIETGLWSNPKSLNQVPCPRAAHVATKLSGDRLVVFGGRHRGRRLGDLYLLDCATMEWTCISSDLTIPDPRTGSVASNSLADSFTRPCGRSWTGMCAVAPDQLLLYGGFTSDERPLNDCWLLDATSWTWKVFEFSSGNRPNPRLWHTAVSPEQGAAYVFGGCEDNIFDETQTKRFARDLLSIRTSPPTLLKLSLNTIAKTTDRWEFQLYRSVLPKRLLALLMLAMRPLEAISIYRVHDVMSLWNPVESKPTQTAKKH